MSSPPGGDAPFSVLVVDPHPTTREGVRAVLHAHPDLRVCGEAGSGPAAVALAGQLSPAVVVCEAGLPGVGAPELVARLRAACPGVKVLVLTARADLPGVRAVVAAGAAGYVSKRAGADDLVLAVRAVAWGGTYFDPEVAGWVAEGHFDPAAGNPDELSEREDGVLRLVARGYSTKEIAARLTVSQKTVESYKARAMGKLGVRGRVGIVEYAIGRGWLGGESTPGSAPPPV